jgi:predicted ATPase with chaperone activity
MRPSGLSARAYLRVLKLVRTVADLAGSESTAVQVLAEALQCTGPGGRVASAP